MEEPYLRTDLSFEERCARAKEHMQNVFALEQKLSDSLLSDFEESRKAIEETKSKVQNQAAKDLLDRMLERQKNLLTEHSKASNEMSRRHGLSMALKFYGKDALDFALAAIEREKIKN